MEKEKQTHDIYTLLKKDHKHVAWLLDRLVACSENKNQEWKAIVDQIRDELIPHSRAEEALFYNAIRDRDPKAEGVGHAFSEHAMAEMELRTLQAMKAIDVNWTTLAKKLRDDLTHHVQHEENEVFAAAERVLTPAEAITIGERFEKLKPRIRDESFVGTTADLVGNLLRRETAGTAAAKSDEAPLDKTGS